MRPLVLLLALCAVLALPACRSEAGPSSALDVQPAVGAGARGFASPQEGVGAAARLDLVKYGFRTGKAAEAPPWSRPPWHPRRPGRALCGRGVPDRGGFRRPAGRTRDPTSGDGRRP